MKRTKVLESSFINKRANIEQVCINVQFTGTKQNYPEFDFRRL